MCAQRVTARKFKQGTQKLFWIEPALHLQVEQNHTCIYCNHLQSILDHCLVWIVEQWAVNIFTEEVIRAGSTASLSSLLNRLDPVLRKPANIGSWQVISPVEVVGYVVVVDKMLPIQKKFMRSPQFWLQKVSKENRKSLMVQLLH